MSRIISTITDSSAIKNRGERIVFEALQKALGPEFLVFYSVPFIREHKKGGNLVDGENDFVVLDQSRGTLLVLEVKEGVISHGTDGNKPCWYQNGRKMDVGPWAQAAGNKYSLVDWLGAKLGCVRYQFPLSHGHAVLLPDVHTSVGSPTPEITEEIALIWDSAEELAAGVADCCEAWQMKGRREPTDEEVDSVRRLLMPEFVYGNTLRDRIGVARRNVLENVAQTDQLLEFIGNRKQARIAGCAGAGKTVLAIAKAKQLAQDDKSVVMLVYNEGIAGYLAGYVKDCPGIHVRTLKAFAQECAQRAGMELPPEIKGDTAGWWSRVAQTLDRALDVRRGDYDAIIVDEAQDFQCTVWLALEKAIKPGGWYYIFYDKEQNIFQSDLQFPISEEPFLLLRNCRSSQAIVNKVVEMTGIQLRAREDLPQGDPVREGSAATPAQRRKLLGKILHDWIRKEGLTENQIVVLGAHSLPNTSIENTGKAGSYQIVERAAAAPGVIPYYTYMAFKGCESDAVILLDVDKNNPRWNNAGLYTAMTRARHLLGVVCKGVSISEGAV